MFQKVFLLNPDMLPCCLLASGSGKMFGKKKMSTREPASSVPERRAVPCVRRKKSIASPFIQNFLTEPLQVAAE